MPNRRKGESKSAFIKRCMSHKETKRKYPDQDQRFAVCKSMAES